MEQSSVPTIYETPGQTDALHGEVFLVWSKVLWIGGIYLCALFGGVATFAWDAVLVFLASSATILCLGHSLGMHRLFVHRSYECPKLLEYFLVYFGVVMGLAGPFGMLRTHDTRDWAQRQAHCHDYFAHRQHFFIDGFWQLICDIRLINPPIFQPEPQLNRDRFYRFLERTWMLQQLPWVLVFWYFGGLPWAVWGVAVRLAVCITGHWFIGYFAHNFGPRTWHVEGAGVQGYNIPFCGLITMGECWHNNHHAFPGSAKLGLYRGQADPGWWVLMILKKLNLVWNVKQENDLIWRNELRRIMV